MKVILKDGTRIEQWMNLDNDWWYTIPVPSCVLPKGMPVRSYLGITLEKRLRAWAEANKSLVERIDP